MMRKVVRVMTRRETAGDREVNPRPPAVRASARCYLFSDV